MLLLLIGTTALPAAAFAQAENILEMEQLQAQVDVMLEEMSELQNYRFCGEQGKVFLPDDSRADDDGCVSPAPANIEPPLQAPAIARGDLAPTAQSFKLGAAPKAAGDENIPLKSIGQSSKAAAIQKLDVDIPAPKPAKAAQTAAPKAPSADIPPIAADFPNDRVKALVEMAVAQALAGAEQANVAEGGVIQPDPAVLNAPLANVQPSLQEEAATPTTASPPPQNAQGALVPSCAEGEFLTVVGGEVVCRRAASAGKMACPPAVLRIYVDWHDQHIHFHMPYTPHGQTQTAQEYSDVVKAQCNNGTYEMTEITRNECGGNVCKEGRRPAYSMTFYCRKDKTDRCYAKQKGRLVNHTFTESYINKQY